MVSSFVDVTKIASTNWSPELELEGQIVENIQDINQAIFIILSSPVGCDPHRPDFATNIQDYIDRPQNVAIPLLVRDIQESIIKWEPRIDIVSIDVDFLPEEIERIEVTIVWQLKNSTLQEALTVRI